MNLHRHACKRKGAIIPLVAVCMVALAGLVAMAIDLGMLMVSKTQAQNVADAMAMTAGRTLDGSSGSKLTDATTNAQAVSSASKILGKSVDPADTTLTYGAYHYDTTNHIFIPQFPPVDPDNYNLVEATVTPSRNSAFGKIFKMSSLKVSATAIAAHRPRDVTLVLDYSGSMNNESDIWCLEVEYGSANQNTPNNKDTVYPQWGPYDTTFSPNATLMSTSADARVGRCNVTTAALGVPAMVDDFFQNDYGAATSVKAFNKPAAAVTNTAQGGDGYLNVRSSSPAVCARTWSQITTGSNTTTPSNKDFDWASDLGGRGYPSTFVGWTQGPGYWGKTFYIWPPNPLNDWRKKYFYLSNGTTPLNDNTKLLNAAGDVNDPSGNYVINYTAILGWIRANCLQASTSDTKPFPPKLRGGKVLYYDAIPTSITTGQPTDHTKANSLITNTNERFWKEYIDYVIGVWRDPAGNIQHTNAPSCSLGGDYTCGTGSATVNVQVTGPDATTLSHTGMTFMSPTDNPKRPRHRFWFGPMTMVQFLSDSGRLHGLTHDISMYPAKLGIQGAIQDASNNHPNDQVALVMFSRPTFNLAGAGGGADPAGIGQFSAAQVSLTRKYTDLITALYYPPGSTNSDVNVFSSNGAQTPCAHGDYNSNTCTNYGLMLAYNEFSGHSSGRMGASRLVILETDGMANCTAGANFTKSVSADGINSSYYNLNTAGADKVWLDNVTAAANGAPSYTGGNSSAGQAALNVAAKMCALTTDNTNGPGFATPSKPVLIHCLAFGAVFEPVASPPSQQGDGMSFLQKLSTVGGTSFPSSVSSTTDPNYFKIIVGDLTQRQNRMKAAFLKIMDSDIPISLVK